MFGGYYSRIGIIGKTNNQEVFSVTKEICRWLDERNIETFVEESLGREINHSQSVASEQLPELVDVVLVLGGDGTFLGVARLVSKYNIPILGINLGGLGFLTEVTTDEIHQMLERIISGDYEIETRDMLRSTIIRGSDIIGNYTVLNDAVINKGAVARMIHIELIIDGYHVTVFRADGIILSTPTGSTAYSLSAGGPIVYPTLPLTIITPICPHTLADRPLVVSNSVKVELKVLTDISDIYLTLDGQIGVNLEVDDVIEVSKAENTVKLIKSPFRDYFTILKTKLMWGERNDSI